MLNQAQKKFVSLLSKVDYSKRLYEVFSDFCTLGTYSLALPFHRDIAAPELERVHSKYTRDQIKLFDEAFTVMVDDMEISEKDFLGEVFGECELANDRQGQFFTPFPISLMMAKMTFHDVKEQIAEKGFLMVSEPACGSGGMIIAVRQALIEEKCNPSRDVFVVAQDVSDIAFMMCYIQLSLYGIAAEVVHGNTITLQIWRTLLTPVYWITDWPLRLALRNLNAGNRNEDRKREPAPAMSNEQLKLF